MTRHVLGRGKATRPFEGAPVFDVLILNLAGPVDDTVIDTHHQLTGGRQSNFCT